MQIACGVDLQTAMAEYDAAYTGSTASMTCAASSQSRRNVSSFAACNFPAFVCCCCAGAQAHVFIKAVRDVARVYGRPVGSNRRHPLRPNARKLVPVAGEHNDTEG